MNLFLTVLEAGKSKIKVWADLASGENLLLGSQKALFVMSSHGRRGKGLL